LNIIFLETESSSKPQTLGIFGFQPIKQNNNKIKHTPKYNQ